MTDHLIAYCKFHNLVPDEIVCEITGRPATHGGVDISHNSARGMGGNPSKDKNSVENLMALHRGWHTFLEKNPSYFWWFQLVHYCWLFKKTPYYILPASFDDPVFNEITNKLT